jgi:hypothetical protein
MIDDTERQFAQNMVQYVAVFGFHRISRSAFVRRQCESLVQAQSWDKAATVCDDVLNYIVNASGGINEDDVRTLASDLDPNIEKFLNLAQTKTVIGVPQNVRNA